VLGGLDPMLTRIEQHRRGSHAIELRVVDIGRQHPFVLRSPPRLDQPPSHIDAHEASVSKFLDMTMLVMQGGGRVRTEDEHRALFEAAGLQLTRIIPTSSPLRLVEGARHT
jgi:hypothetical protein